MPKKLEYYGHFLEIFTNKVVNTGESFMYFYSFGQLLCYIKYSTTVIVLNINLLYNFHYIYINTEITKSYIFIF